MTPRAVQQQCATFLHINCKSWLYTGPSFSCSARWLTRKQQSWCPSAQQVLLFFSAPGGVVAALPGPLWQCHPTDTEWHSWLKWELANYQSRFNWSTCSGLLHTMDVHTLQIIWKPCLYFQWSINLLSFWSSTSYCFNKTSFTKIFWKKPVLAILDPLENEKTLQIILVPKEIWSIWGWLRILPKTL